MNFNSEAFSIDIDPDVTFIAVAYTDGCLDKIDLKTMTNLETRMQLFPKEMKNPKTIIVHSQNTFGLVFKCGSVLVCKKSLKGEIVIISKLF